MKDPAATADDEGNRGVTDRRLEDVERLVIPAQHLVLVGKPIRSHAEVVRIAVLTEYPRMPDVSLKCFRDDHGGALNLKSMIETVLNSGPLFGRRRRQELEVVDPAPEVFAFK